MRRPQAPVVCAIECESGDLPHNGTSYVTRTEKELNDTPVVRNLSVMEALSVTGVAKALLAFYKTAREEHWAKTSLATYVRLPKNGSLPAPNAFIQAMEELHFQVSVIPEKSAFDAQALRGLRRVIRESNPDIVETHAVKSHVLMRVGRPRGTKWVAFHHGYTTPDLKMKLYNRLNPWALRAADLVVTVCQPFADQLSREGVPRGRIRVLPNAIEPFRLASEADTTNLRASLNISPEAFVFVSIGRLSGEKGHRYLVDAFAQIENRDAVLVLVGDGPERQTLECQAANTGAGARVRFAGHQSNPVPYYGIADVFVLPSLSEGSPLVLLEAMTARVPIIASAVGGVPETLTDQRSGLLVPSQDPKALAAAMTRLMEEPELRSALSRQASEHVQTRHAPRTYSEEMIGLYRGLLSGKKVGKL